MFSVIFAFINRIYQVEDERLNWVENLNLNIISIITVIQIFILLFKYYIYLLYYRSQYLIQENSLFISYNFIFKIIKEFFIILFHPNSITKNFDFSFIDPVLKIKVIYKYNDILEILSLLKFVMILEIILMNTIWLNDKSKWMASIYQININNIFSIKCLMKEYPLMTIFLTLLISILMHSFALNITEAPVNFEYENLENFFNCFYGIIVMMTTVGYGTRYQPVTFLGFLMSFSSVIIGMILLSILIVGITNYLESNNQELYSYYTIKRIKLKVKIKDNAIKILQNYFKVLLLRKKNNKKFLKIHVQKLKKLIIRQKNLRLEMKKYNDTSISLNILNLICKIQQIKENLKF